MRHANTATRVHRGSSRPDRNVTDMDATPSASREAAPSGPGLALRRISLLSRDSCRGTWTHQLAEPPHAISEAPAHRVIAPDAESVRRFLARYPLELDESDNFLAEWTEPADGLHQRTNLSFVLQALLFALQALLGIRRRIWQRHVRIEFIQELLLDSPPDPVDAAVRRGAYDIRPEGAPQLQILAPDGTPDCLEALLHDVVLVFEGCVPGFAPDKVPNECANPRVSQAHGPVLT